MKKRSWMMSVILSNSCFLIAAFAENLPITEPGSDPVETETVKVARIDSAVVKEFEKAWTVSSASIDWRRR